MAAPFSSATPVPLPPERLSIEPLRVTPRGPRSSGFRGVYWYRKDDHGRDVWVAKFKCGGSKFFHEGKSRGGGHPIPGSQSTDPRTSAQFVARKYLEIFGPQWPLAVLARSITPYQIRRRPDGTYVALVWVMGCREEVVTLRRRKGDRWRRGARWEVFATVEAARAGIGRYLVRLYGLYAAFMLYRSAPPVRAGSLAAVHTPHTQTRSAARGDAAL